MKNMRLIFALIITYLTFGMLLNTVGTVILRSMASLDVSKGAAGWFDGCKDISIAIISFATASYLPRIGLKRAMLAGLALAGAACALMPLLPSYATICVHYMLIGMAFALVKVGVYAMIGLVTEDKAAHASLTSIIEGGFMIGVLGVTLLFSRFVGNTLNDSSQSWLNAYWILAGLCALAFMVLLIAPVDETPLRSDVSGHAALFDMVRLAKLPLVLVFIYCTFTYVFIEQGIGTWLPTFNNEVLHLPQAMSVVAGSLYAGALAAGRIIGGAVIRKSGWFPVLLTCLVIVGAVILLIGPLSHTDRSHTVMDWAHAPLAAYLFLGIGFFMAPIYPTIVSVILSANPKSRHTALMGLVVVFSALGGTTDSRLTAELFRRIDGATAFTLMVVPVGLLLAGLILLRGQSRNYISK